MFDELRVVYDGKQKKTDAHINLDALSSTEKNDEKNGSSVILHDIIDICMAMRLWRFKIWA